ncbi:beta-L-arabinofuranosidase domain-containing protein [Kibdelosporangium aridum]|uniref:beta-L-arabinofuranosidase domain-containing protein n=1 Tax=Kibdelosporangium aridum TaxID=2030 RepID=UPI00068F11F4
MMIDRRSLLKVAVVAPLATTATTGQAFAESAPPALRPFALRDVTLSGGVFADKRALMLAYARGYDVNRLVQVFRANAGLPTGGAVAPGGWEGLDGEANGNLRGHYTGHFLSMLAQAYGSTGEPVFAEKISTIVGALVECRAALRRDPVPLSVPGRFGTGLEFIRGSYQYLDLPPNVLGGSAAVTLSAWVKPTHASTWARIFDFGNDTTRYMYLTARNNNGVPRFAITTNGGGSEQAINGTASLPLGEWSHIAVTVEGTTGVLYVNGSQVAVNTAMSLNPAVLGQVRNNWVGRSNYAADPAFAGVLDDVNIWSRALTASEIAGLRNSPGKGDLASYSFDSGLSDATLRRTWGSPSHPGFLAAYPETQFITLETMTRSDYTVVWAPYYTAHKILKGLLDAYLNTGDARALDLSTGMADWMYARLRKLSAEVLQRMWGLFSSGEFGGLVEAITDLHQITGNADYLALAKLFDLNSLIDACAANRDVLEGLHANQHIPIFTGLVRLHESTGEQRYLTAAKNFWDMVVPHRMYSIGGTSEREFWRARGAVASTLTDVNAETCCAHNMLKLSRSLFAHDQNPKYMDYFERALVNQILGSKQDQADPELPLVTYFIGLAPGSVRDYTPKQGTTCCEGTGMESATKYQDTVYFQHPEGLYVNLYMPSTVRWQNVTVTQTTAYPFEQASELRISGNATFDLHLRIPGWARKGVTVTINGSHHVGKPTPGSYLTISRAWRSGDTVRVEMPFTLRAEQALDRPDVQSLMYGPVHLVARDSRTAMLEFSLYRNATLSGDLVRSLTPVAGKPLHYTLDGVELAPFFEGTADPFHSYFRRVEPRVVFGGLDAGVANVVRDGTSFLDTVWSAAPFPTKTDFVTRVDRVADRFYAGEDRTRVTRTARHAPLWP